MVSFQDQIDEIIPVLQALAGQAATIDQIAALVRDTVLGGGTLFTAGNGGSATDAQHLAEELIGRYRSNHRALPAIAISADASVLTCIANDFGYDALFSRQIEGLARPGDVLVVFTTSGNSPNIVAALDAANARGVATVALLGKTGGACQGLANLELIVASDNSARIQEAHLQVLHYICEVVEAAVVSV